MSPVLCEKAPSFYLVEVRKLPMLDHKVFNQPHYKELNVKHSYATEKFNKYQKYFLFMNAKIKNANGYPSDRPHILKEAAEKLNAFVDAHIKDLKRLLYVTDQALGSMITIKLTKRMEATEDRIIDTEAKIPYALYASTEYDCLKTRYFMISSHNQEDVNMILRSERKPHCYNYRGAFSFLAHYHKRTELHYKGPHAEKFKTNDPSQGLFCYYMEPESQEKDICLFRTNPREEFPASVEFQPKISYYCGPYHYFIPATTDIRCVFSILRMDFIFHFAYDGARYQTSGMNFIFGNGQVFYTDEPWSGMSCWNWVCKWRHNQNQRGNAFFSNN